MLWSNGKTSKTMGRKCLEKGGKFKILKLSGTITNSLVRLRGAIAPVLLHVAPPLSGWFKQCI
jgi:hypothetical protein